MIKYANFLCCLYGPDCLSFTKRSQISSPNAHVVLAAIKQVILRSEEDENCCEMYKKMPKKKHFSVVNDMQIYDFLVAAVVVIRELRQEDDNGNVDARKQ